MTEDTVFLPGLSPLDDLDIHARFDGGSLSCEGGVLLLREIERGLNFADTLAACLHDKRDPLRTRHTYSSMIRSRVLAIACGYEDCDDHDELRHDPAFKMACERLPDTGHALASQPTLSRLENTPSWRQLARIMRTAANSAALTKLVAPGDSKSLAIIGAGVQGHAHMTALSTVYEFEEITVWSRTEDNARAFAGAHGARHAPTVEAAVRDADIVVCSTNSREPLLEGRWLKEGCHVNSVGSPRHDWRELDDAVMANTVIVDCRKSVLEEAGDIIHSGATIHAEAGDVMSGKIHIDRNKTTVFKSVGIAVQDIATARMVYERYRANCQK